LNNHKKTTSEKTIPVAESGNQKGRRIWPSFEIASCLYDWANIGLICALVAGVISTILVVWMGNVKETYLRRDIADNQERAAASPASLDHLLCKGLFQRFYCAGHRHTIANIGS